MTLLSATVTRAVRELFTNIVKAETHEPTLTADIVESCWVVADTSRHGHDPTLSADAVTRRLRKESNER